MNEINAKSLFKPMVGTFYMTDLEGRLVFASPSVEKLIGYTVEELLGTRGTDLYVAKNQRQQFLQQLEENDGQLFSFQTILHHKDGRKVRVTASASYCYDKDGNITGIEGIVRDITAEYQGQETLKTYQKNLEKLVEERTAELQKEISKGRQKVKALQKSRKMLQLVINNIPQAVFWKDRNSTFLGCNQILADDVGFDQPEDVIGKTDYDFSITREQADAYREDDEHVMESGKPLRHIHETLRKPDGTEAWLDTNKIPLHDEDGEVVGILCTYENITERKKSKESLDLLMSAIEQISEAVMITDPEGYTQYVNPAFEKLTGYSREEAIGQHPVFLSSGKQDKAFFEKMWTTLRQGDVWSGHFSNKKKDGSLFEEEATISPVKNSEGQITNFIAVKRDVTQEISLEKQLRQAMKMEAIGTLAGGIAHDFNNILSAMLGYSEIAKERLTANDPIRKDLDQVINAGHRAADLVSQILTFSRHGDDEFRPLNVQPIIKEVLNLLRSSMPTTIQLKQSVAAEGGTILANPTRIHQLLMNLGTNAIHAIDNGIGTITVSLARVIVTAADGVADCPQLAPGAWLDLEVSDTGYGMDGLTQSKIFDPFFTTKEKGQGTGLGLAVVHGIIKQHKGEVTVASEPGQGTVFHIYLPISHEEEGQAEQNLSKDIPRGRGERILFVDDETIIALMMQQILDSLGYTVSIFTSSIEALAVYEKNPDDFDLVITDMAMPEMTGLVLTRKLLALRPDLPVILCTGFSEVIDNEKKAKSFGIREYIQKPADKRTLAKAIRKVLKPSRYTRPHTLWTEKKGQEQCQGKAER